MKGKNTCIDYKKSEIPFNSASIAENILLCKAALLSHCFVIKFWPPSSTVTDILSSLNERIVPQQATQAYFMASHKKPSASAWITCMQLIEGIFEIIVFCNLFLNILEQMIFPVSTSCLGWYNLFCLILRTWADQRVLWDPLLQPLVPLLCFLPWIRVKIAARSLHIWPKSIIQVLHLEFIN